MNATTTTHRPEFVILGSGVSTATPRISCIIRPKPYRCPVCHEAQENPRSKNRRCNVSALVLFGKHTILIDCGKTIREAATTHFPKLGVTHVDAIVLTHGHADAIMGLDDARDIQMPGSRDVINGKTVWGPTPTVPIFLNSETMAVCKNVFPYLIPEEVKPGQPKDIKRRVSALSWNVYKEPDYFKPFMPIPEIGVTFVPIPLYHGGTYICMGFVIDIPATEHSEQRTIAYLSDLHELPKSSLDYLLKLPKIHLLVVDLLTNSKYNKSHFNRDSAIECARKIGADETVAVGMTCSIGDHETVNQELAELENEGLKFRLSYDGERFPC